MRREHHSLTRDDVVKRVPNAVTFCNLAFGVLAILSAANQRPAEAALLILGAALCDFNDGRLARQLHSVSQLGKQLDSLSDLVSFGVVPALLMWSLYLNTMRVAGTLAVLSFIACGALRLARYNTAAFEGYYTGLPITVSGLILASIALLPVVVRPMSMAVLMFMLSYAMISSRLVIKKIFA